MRIKALCHTCRHHHTIDFDPQIGPGAAFSDWCVKHPGPICDVDFLWPERSGKVVMPEDGWLGYLANANVNVAYAASAAYTITLASLASSSTLVAGQESTALSNASNKYLDLHVAGKITPGTSPTVSKTIELWAIGALDDTPTWPDVFDGTDSAETVTTRNLLNGYGKPCWSALTSATSDEGNAIAPFSMAQQFGGTLPIQHVLFVTHNTAQNLNATGGNHYIKYTPLTATVV